MELTLEIRLADAMVHERDDLLRSLEADLKKVNAKVSVSSLDSYTLADPNLLHIIVQTIGSLDPGSAVAGAAGVGIAPRVLRRAITRLAAFAKKFAQPLPIKVGDISFELPPDTPAAQVGKIVTQLAAQLRQQLPAPPGASRDGNSRRKVKTNC